MAIIKLLLVELSRMTCRNGAQIPPGLFSVTLTHYYPKRINTMESLYPHMKFLILELVVLC
jgi:hypothetical protein